MPRPKFKITRDAAYTARQYCKRKFALDPYWPRPDTHENAEALSTFPNSTGEALGGDLQTWCERWLSTEQFRQLQGALRSRKKRNLEKEPPKTLTLSHEAWLMVSELAKRDKVTVSTFLINRLSREWMELEVIR